VVWSLKDKKEICRYSPAEGYEIYSVDLFTVEKKKYILSLSKNKIWIHQLENDFSVSKIFEKEFEQELNQKSSFFQGHVFYIEDQKDLLKGIQIGVTYKNSTKEESAFSLFRLYKEDHQFKVDIIRNIKSEENYYEDNYEYSFLKGVYGENIQGLHKSIPS